MAHKMAHPEILNDVDTAALKETCVRIRRNPQIAKCEFRANGSWMKGGHNQVKVQNYYAAGEEQKRQQPFVFEADEPPILLGRDQGANPVEYLLTALSSCMTTSIVYHASAKGYKIHALSSEFKGDLDLQGFLGLDLSVPKGFQKIHATFNVSTDAPPSLIKEWYGMSPVYNMLSKSVPIDVTITQT